MQWDRLFGMDPELLKRLTPQQRQQITRSGMLDAGLAMLANSGYSTMPTTLGQVVAGGAMAGRQGAQSALGQSLGFAEMLRQEQEAKAAREAQEAQRRAYAEYVAKMPEGQRQMYMALGLDKGREAIVAEAKERAKAPAQTSLQKEAAMIYPDDPKAQRDWIRAQREKPTGTTVTLSMPGDSDRLGRIATPEEIAFMRSQGANIPQGMVLQMTKDGWKPIQGTGPNKDEQKAEAARAGKVPAAANANMMFDQMEALLDEGLQTGPIAGSEGPWGVPLGRAVDYDRKTMFDAFAKQVSPNLRAIFRIPGEGALSDSEQKQYNLMLPQLTYPESVNRQLIANLRVMLSQSVPAQSAQDDDALINKYLGN